MTDVTFHLWLEPLELAGRCDATLFIRTPGHLRTWVHERYGPLLHEAASAALGVRTQVELVGEGWVQPVGEEERADPAGGGDLNPKYTFDQFVIGSGNQLAHAAALTAAEQPAHAYNPLFIHGRPGLGKTHLLHAIGNYLRSYDPALRVRYATFERFTSEFVHAARGGDTQSFRERFRDVDVLLVDDVQFIANKEGTKEEFFHTFNALYETGRQLVITNDRPPADMTDFEARLTERFESGLVANLEAPDADVRLAILAKRASVDGLAVTDATLAELAELVPGSVRALEGALIRVVAYASLQDTAPSPALVRAALGRAAPGPVDPPPPALVDILDATAGALGVSRSALLLKDRARGVARARQVAMYLARELTDESLPAIGRHFGGRNHSTVLHAHRRIVAALPQDRTTREQVDAVRSRLGRPC